MSFEKINLIKPIQKALAEEGYKTPTPIQQQAIPVVLDKHDLLGCAQTGTGKTAAFAIPILQMLHDERKDKFKRRVIRSLIVTPTRELAIQIGESFSAYGKYTGLKNAVVFGGVRQKAQTDKLAGGVDILIATPGRLLDLMSQNYIMLHNIEMFVLDEADRMLDMGFINDVKKIIAKLPTKRQSLFFSATMPPEIVKLARTILVKPIKIEVTPESTTVEAIKQSVYNVAKSNKKSLLVQLMKDPAVESALVFTKTKHGAEKLMKQLNKENIAAQSIHGNKSQNARQSALANFKSKKIRVLVATDIAARGIDIDELSHVINYEIPNIPETYVHRIGRTGRAGLGGVAISFCDIEERAYWKDIIKLICIPVPVIEEHQFKIDFTQRSVEKSQDAIENSHKHKSNRRSETVLNKSKKSNDFAASNPKRKRTGERKIWTNK